MGPRGRDLSKDGGSGGGSEGEELHAWGERGTDLKEEQREGKLLLQPRGALYPGSRNAVQRGVGGRHSED